MSTLVVRLIVIGLVLLLPLPAWAVTITETFTHADQAGNVSADHTWTDVFGDATFGIFSNTAKASGAPATFDGIARMEVDGDLTSLMTVQATMTFFSGGDATHLVRVGVCLQVSPDATYDAYCFDYDVSAGTQLIMLKIASGSASQIGSAAYSATANDIFKLTWNPSNHQLIGSINGTAKITVTDATITTRARAGLHYGSQDAAAFVQLDTFSLDPQAPAAGTALQQGGRQGRSF